MDSGIRYLPLKPVTARQAFRPDVRQQTSEVGFPIRKSADQSLFAAPHGLSQRTTSFIACAYQGIHRTPLFHLIALISNARPSRSLAARERDKRHSLQPGHVRPEGRTATGPPACLERQCGHFSITSPSRRRDRKDQCHTRIFRRPMRSSTASFRSSALWRRTSEKLFSSRCQ